MAGYIFQVSVQRGRDELMEPRPTQCPASSLNQGSHRRDFRITTDWRAGPPDQASAVARSTRAYLSGLVCSLAGRHEVYTCCIVFVST